MKISLITTVYNEENNIKDFLDSIFSMTIIPDEIVIVDAGSKDKTQNIISEYREKYPIIKLIISKGCNIAKGRNIAIQNSTFDIIAVTDAGCVIDKNWFRNITKPFDDEEVDVVSGWYKPLIKNKFEEYTKPLLFEKLESINRDEFLPSSRSIAFRKNIFDKSGGYPEFLTFAGEDTLFDRKLKKIGAKFIFAENAIVLWEPRSDLKSFKKQIYLYSLGDGEANNLNEMYRKKIFSFTIIILLVLSSIMLKTLIGSVAVLSFIIYKYRGAIIKNKQYIFTTIPLCIIMEVYQIKGYIAGRRNLEAIEKSIKYMD